MSTRSIAAAAPEAPCINVPPVTNLVVIDGTINPHEWQNAAVIRHIHPLGKDQIAHPLTEFLCQYSKDALFVAVRCYENTPGYPHAFPRKPTGDLMQDDAIQVVLGMANPLIVNRKVLQMGGYPGALGTKTAAADFYYQFTVNSVNARSRTYNETPLQRPLFQSAVKTSKTGWTVEMKIPFRSFGLTNPAGKTIFANFFRFRPPAMLGWNLPNFGGYYPMPFGKMKLLPPEAPRSEITREKLPPALAANSPPNGERQSAATARPEIKLGYYPLSGAVVGTFRANSQWCSHGLEAQLLVNGRLAKSQPLNDTNLFNLIFEIPAGSQPRRTLEARLIDPDGKVMAQSRRTFKAVKAPVWFDCQAGKDYLNKKIPKPWAAPVVTGNEIRLVQERIRIGKFGLFSSIRDHLGELLAGRAQIEVILNGRRLHFKKGPVRLSRDGNYVLTEAVLKSGPARLETRSRIDYDGFTEIKLRLLGVNPSRVDRLTVAIPLRSNNARFVLPKVLVQHVRPLTGFGFECGSGPLWVGCEDKGIEFSYDNINPFLSTNNRSRIRVIQGRSRSWLKFDLVDGPGQIHDAEHVFRFFLQPTPTKPRSRVPTHQFVQWRWENWADHQGEIDLSKVAALRKWTAHLAEKGLIGTVYTCQGLAGNDSDFLKYRSDLEIQPPWMFYRRAYNPGKGVPCFATCKRGPDAQRIYYGLEQLATKAGIRGLYDDGMSIAWADANPAHPYGCGRKQIATWSQWTPTRVTQQRNFLKRVRGIFDALGGQYNLTAHTGGGLDINTLSFYDSYLEGEQLARYQPGFEIPLSTFAVGYSGQPWGFRGDFYDQTWRHQRGENLSLIYALLHDCDYEGDTSHYLRIVKDFAGPQSSFHPYWRPGPDVHVSNISPTTSYHPPISYYLNTNEQEALIIVGNLEYNSNTVTVDLNKLFPGKTLLAWDVFANDTKASLVHRHVTKKLPGWQSAVWRIEAISKNRLKRKHAWHESGYVADNWHIVGPTNITSLASNNAARDHSLPVEIQSATDSDRSHMARLRFIAHAFSTTGHVQLNLKHSGRVGFCLGKSGIYYDDGWHVKSLTGGILFQPSAKPGEPVEMNVSLDDGSLDASYGDQPLVAGMRMVESSSSNSFSITTWGGDSVAVDPVDLGSTPDQIYKPANDTYELAHAAKAKQFAVDFFQPSDWSFSTDAPEATQQLASDVFDERAGAVLHSTAHKSATTATFTHAGFGLNGTVAIWIKHNGRFQLTLGPAGLRWDSHWQLSGRVSGWNNGQLFQPTVVTNKPVLLVLTLKNGKLSAVYHNEALAKDLSLAGLQPGDNLLRLSTWGGDSLSFAVQMLSSQPQSLFNSEIQQPVR